MFWEHLALSTLGTFLDTSLPFLSVHQTRDDMLCLVPDQPCTVEIAPSRNDSQRLGPCH